MLKQKLTSASLLAYVDYSNPLQVYTAGSLQGLGAVLAQVQDSCEWVIAYTSLSLRPTEKNPQNYRFLKLELLALVWAINKKFAEYLTGTADIEVFTDNNLFAYLDTAKQGVLEQWWVTCLAQFKYKIHYRPGKRNRHTMLRPAIQWNAQGRMWTPGKKTSR